MKGTINLKNVVEYEGKKRNTIEYDTDAITADLTIKACALATQESMTKAGSVSGLALEFDYPTQLMLGFAAAEAVDPDMDMAFLKKHVRGVDIMKFLDIGANFTRSSASDDAEQTGSEDASETTADASTLQQQTSEE